MNSQWPATPRELSEIAQEAIRQLNVGPIADPVRVELMATAQEATRRLNRALIPGSVRREKNRRISLLFHRLDDLHFDGRLRSSGWLAFVCDVEGVDIPRKPRRYA
jgi:hypothetical protein